jgi:pyruvate,water dikinase
VQRLSDREQALVLVQAPFPLDDAEMSARLRVQQASHHIGLPRKSDATLAEGAVALDVLTHLNITMGFLDTGSESEVVQGDVIVRPTSSSIIEGVCRIITDPRTDRLDPGEILIATSTTPDFMPAMRHAKALLVDQGGVLSHAALTSRELGTPCIVGASVATVRFRTGDVIRLDFDTGAATLATVQVGADV